MSVSWKVVLALCALVPSVLWSGYVFSVLWEWFMVQKLGVTSINVATAIGLSTIAVFFTRHLASGDPVSSKDDKALTIKVLGAYVTPAVTLLFGWVAHLFA